MRVAHGILTRAGYMLMCLVTQVVSSPRAVVGRTVAGTLELELGLQGSSSRLLEI